VLDPERLVELELLGEPGPVGRHRPLADDEIDRIAGDEVDQKKHQRHHHVERGDQEKQASENIVEHA
jgi:hypothetical protein